MESVKLLHEIESLPADSLNELIEFVKRLKLQKANTASETCLLSEEVLARDWNTPDEDALWANL
jgi:hypothetical protein